MRNTAGRWEIPPVDEKSTGGRFEIPPVDFNNFKNSEKVNSKTLSFLQTMEATASTKTHTCRCCNKQFDTAKQKSTHEFGMWRSGKGPEKKTGRNTDCCFTLTCDSKSTFESGI